MARRLIGLDVGTNAVTIAEVTPGTPPRLDMFAQVALPREAMREGEVADEAAVTDAVTRLRNEVGLKKAAVRVGIASPRVIVRQVEMPVMTRPELASALHFQAGDLIPISLEDAVLDFAILGENAPGSNPEDGGEPTMQVLLAAAQEATIMRLVSAVEAGGLQVAAVDLIPLALTRALARPVHALAPAPVPATVGGGVALADDEGVGAEGIVSFGGGVTAIAVHEGGVPRFVRVLGTGGRELTDAIAHELDVPVEAAEALKRATGAPSSDEMVARARTAMDRPLSVLLDEVRSSIDYYRNQPGAARLQRVFATGGSAQMPGLHERLAALVGVPVEPAYMHDLIRVGDIGFAPDELPRLEPYLPAAVGLALGGANVGTVVDLLPRTRRSSVRSRARVNPKIVAPVAVAVVLLGGLTFLGRKNVSSAKSKQAAAETQVQKLRNQLGRLQQSATPTGQSANLQGHAASVLGTDVGWTKLMGDMRAALPGGVWLTTMTAQHTLAVVPAAGATSGNAGAAGSSGSTGASGSASATANNAANAAASTSGASSTTGPAGAADTSSGATTGAAGGGTCESYEQPLSGPVAMTGIANSLPALAAFLDNLDVIGAKNNVDISGVTLASAQKAKFGEQDVITFSLNATIDAGARSDRLRTFFQGALCK
jgi:type IV pilus assembly protein PilM